MQFDAPANDVSNDVVVARLYDLAREGDTTNREYQLLDYVVQKRLEQTYGGEITRAAYAA